MPQPIRDMIPTIGNVLTGKHCLYAWTPGRSTNFGDELGPAIVQRCLARQQSPSAALRRCSNQRRIARFERRLLSVGSVVHAARRNDVVWGSGINGKAPSRSYDFRGIDFRAVRGPLTRDLILEYGGRCPAVFGDPALLIPTLFPEFPARPAHAASGPAIFIANLNDEAFKSRLPNPKHHQFERIPTQTPWEIVTRRIIATSLVVSSSLHGIILADVFGVPCRPLQSLFEPLFKFEDYFLATGRNEITFAGSFAQAIELGPIPSMNYDPKPLLDAFPIDVFT